MKPDFDTLIIGSGAAGLIAAIALAEKGFRVLVATKDAVTESSSAYAQGGIAVPLAPEDSIESHVQDTLKVGGGFCDEKVVRFYVGAIKEHIETLAEWGVPFVGLRRGQVDPSILGNEGAHSHRRVLKVGSDISGRALMKSLWETACRNPNVSISQGTSLIELMQEPIDGSAIGAVFQDINNTIFQITSHTTVLATGGFSSIFQRSTNPYVSTGDGLACAERIGAKLRKIEFVQFHPTALDLPNCFLISEALRGEGSQLINAKGERFMHKYSPDLELAQRAVVSAAVWKEIAETGKAFLDARPMGAELIRSRFPNIHEFCLSLGFDMTHEMLPITPAAHYTIGGLAVNEELQTNIKNLWAIGEVANTGLHGADRLASNSLLECVVSAFEAAKSISLNINKNSSLAEIPELKVEEEKTKFSIIEAKQKSKELKALLWQHASFERNSEQLKNLLNEINSLLAELPSGISSNPFFNQLVNQTYMSKLFVQACLNEG